jgi:hypothetical protein
LDPNNDGPGTNTGLRDIGEEDDSSARIDLPFQFTYYGQHFDEVTICTNGWMACGNYADLVGFRNRHIPDGENIPGMIAPFWDELITVQNSGVYYWFDRENHRFIVEWSNMLHFGPGGMNEPRETFEVILYDPVFHPSFTGDGHIEFQYLDVADVQSSFQTWDTPFASVGIASPDLTTGLEYTYWNRRPASAAPLQDGRAIKFTTAPPDTFLAAKGGNTSAPLILSLSEPIPNPFNSSTVINYVLDRDSYVSLGLYDVNGREVVTLVSGYQRAGRRTLTLGNSGLPSGVYLLKLGSMERVFVKKVVCIR